MTALRAPTAADWPALAALHARAFAGAAPAPWSAAALAAAAGMAGADGRVAGGDPPLGLALWRCAGDEAELLTLAVDPAHQRRGAGAALLAETMRAAATAGAQTLFLEVAADAAPARALYAAAGFAPVGRRRDYYRGATGARADAIVMRRALARLP